MCTRVWYTIFEFDESTAPNINARLVINVFLKKKNSFRVRRR